MTEAARPSGDERAARLRAARAVLEQTSTAAPHAADASNSSAPAGAATPQPRRKRPGGGARLAFAGGAVGLGFGLVAVMAAGVADETPPSAATAVRRIVVSPADAPAGPVIVIVGAPFAESPTLDAPVAEAVGRLVSTEADRRSIQIEVPERAAAPAPVTSAPSPVTTSRGS